MLQLLYIQVWYYLVTALIQLFQDAKTTPCVRYAQGVLSGTYDNKVFDGLVEAVVTKHDREERGVGMQNFQYAPAWDEMCHILKIHSPHAYESLSSHLPMHTIRSFQYVIILNASRSVILLTGHYSEKKKHGSHDFQWRSAIKHSC